MLSLVALAMQLVAQPPAILSVRVGDRSAVVPIVQTSAGPAFAPERLSPIVDAQLRADGSGRYLLTIEGVSFQLSEQIPFTRIGNDVVPMVGAPFVSGSRLHVPLQIVAEFLPRFLSGSLYDPERGELRIMRTSGAPAPGTRPATTGATPQSGVSGSSATQSVSPAASPPGGRGSGTLATAPKPSAPVAGRTASTPPRRRVVVVDAGHGGHDGGTSGRTRTGKVLIEKDVALAVAKLLETELRKRDVDVVMTRSTDVFIPLPMRGKIANDRHGDLFISVHVNASAPRAKNAASARGVETYFLAVAKTEDAQRVADMENASVRFETGAHVDKEDPLSFILNDMAENEHLRESSDLAALIQQRLTAHQPAFDRGVKQGPFRVLVTSYMPAVLVELGYASNVDDAAVLLDAANQRKMAQGIASAAMDYFAAYERRVGIGQPDR
jgi:N-acetylmuramoyl-L-alanine amidase